LIAAADAEILLPMREDPANHWMTLKRPTNMPGSSGSLFCFHIIEDISC
jgi:hypothetical protein